MDTLIFGTIQLLNITQFIGFPGTYPCGEPIYCYLMTRNGILSSFSLYQEIPNYSSSYPDGDGGAQYILYLNGNPKYTATIPGSIQTDTTPVNLLDNTTTVSVNAGDLFTCQIIPNDPIVFQGGSQLLISCIFTN